MRVLVQTSSGLVPAQLSQPSLATVMGSGVGGVGGDGGGGGGGGGGGFSFFGVLLFYVWDIDAVVASLFYYCSRSLFTLVSPNSFIFIFTILKFLSEETRFGGTGGGDKRKEKRERSSPLNCEPNKK